jgi:regulator of protease activity HflC (stomatin/prohibitin superfamily)
VTWRDLIPILVFAAIVGFGAIRRAASVSANPRRQKIVAALSRASNRVVPAGTTGLSRKQQKPALSQETHMNPISVLILFLFLIAAGVTVGLHMSPVLPVILVIIGFYFAFALKMAQQWDRAVVLRLGKLHAVRGPGLFFLVPIVDQVTTWIDQRIRTSEFSAEQALTRDTVPVNVDAIVFWMVHDAERAALEIADYNSAVQRVAQTSLRETIGSSLLSDLLADRKEADAALKETIGAKTAEWGVTVNSVEIRDVAIPANLQDAMSRQAQAEREKQARVTLGAAEEEVAQKFVNAAKLYAQNPEALQLRAMNIIYETTKERGATILMPSSMVDAMNPGSAAALLNRLSKIPPE